MKKVSFLTFDVEEWYHANYEGLDYKTYENEITNLDSAIDGILLLCEKHNIQATFFVLGIVAQKKPHIVRKLVQAGHEVASHGFSHELVYRMSPKAFRHDLSKSIDILQDIAGQSVSGYRAPSWSIKQENLPWFYSILEQYGLTYSSSIYPAQTFLYGIPDFIPYPHSPTIEGHKVGIIEFPVPVFRIMGKAMGFSGGFYFRMLPIPVIHLLFYLSNKRNCPVFIYLHPREVFPNNCRLPLSPIPRFIHYYGIGQTRKKLTRLLSIHKHRFMRMDHYIGLGSS